MAVKKSELYSSLWASCDSLHGGMDSSQYKDYILTLLFVKYVSDKFKGVAYGDIDVPKGGSFADMLVLIGDDIIGDAYDRRYLDLNQMFNSSGNQKTRING
ncbi:hypothetical protein SDC9_69626 [bioreactor metagenome]|jgi:type I restriction enzyme M protein|uniref:N6 adenine-specific DNA methyltransferase N-terminal domain-containing protein n=1 Tax=bioreactor metagenome TaxID=1076179 RepID=A0A644Y3M5_9ZZZZ